MAENENNINDLNTPAGAPLPPGADNAGMPPAPPVAPRNTPDSDMPPTPPTPPEGNKKTTTIIVIAAVCAVLLIGGGALLGQYLGWWYSDALSFVGTRDSGFVNATGNGSHSGDYDEDTSIVAVEEIEATDTMAVEEAVVAAAEYGIEGYHQLHGSVGKYPIRMSINLSNGQVSGSYYYTKSGSGASIDIEGYYVEPNITFAEYSNGELCGEWTLRSTIDGAGHLQLAGSMVNYKGDTYNVSLSE